MEGAVRIPLADRKRAVAAVPWIAYCDHNALGRCESTRGGAPLKMHFSPDVNVQRDAYERYRCKNTAHWIYVSLGQRIARVCWLHLSDELHYSDAELARWDAWADEHWPFKRPDDAGSTS